MKRLAGLLTLVLVIHGMAGLWFVRSARLGAAAPVATTVTQVELRPREVIDRSTLSSTESSAEGPIEPRSLDSQAATEADSTALASALTDPARSGSAATDPAATDPVPNPVDSDPSATPAAEPPPAIASPAPEVRERVWPELDAGRSTRRLRVFFGDYSAGQPVARLQLEVEVTPPHYRLRTVGEAEGLIALFYSGTLTQESRGQLGPQGLLPQEYVETRGSRRQRAVRFDQNAGQLLPADAPAVVLPQGTQDRLSVLYQLGLMARAQPERFVAGAVIALPVAGLREVRLERFEVVGDELLLVQDRSLRTVHLKRPLIQAGRDPSVQVWLGYDAGLQPVRIRLEDAKGQVLDQVIDEP